MQHQEKLLCGTSLGKGKQDDQLENISMQLLNPTTDSIRTVAGSGSAGFSDGDGGSSRLSEPGGLAQGADGVVYVADTNNSLIRRAICWYPVPTGREAAQGLTCL